MLGITNAEKDACHSSNRSVRRDQNMPFISRTRQGTAVISEHHLCDRNDTFTLLVLLPHRPEGVRIYGLQWPLELRLCNPIP